MKKTKKNNMYVLVILLAISLLVILGSIRLLSSNSESFFARLKIRNKKIQILYNYNLFDASTYTNNIVKKYNNKLQVITLNGKMNSAAIELGKLDVSLKKGEKYRVIVKNVGGNYKTVKGSEPKFVFELQKDEKNADNRAKGIHYISEVLPSKVGNVIDKVIIVDDKNINSNNFRFWLYQKTSGSTSFNNYEIQVLITKVETKIVNGNGTYGKLPTPVKDGYEFLGWYDSLSGSNKIESTTKISRKYNHKLYAHWNIHYNDPIKPKVKYAGECSDKTKGGKFNNIPYLYEGEYCSFESKTLKYYIEQQKYHRITYIWAKDPYNQMKVAISAKDTDGTYKKQHSTDIIKQEISQKGYANKGLIGVNASAMIPWGEAAKDAPYNWKGQPRLNLFINNGKIIRYDPNTYWFHHRHYGLTKKGWLKDYFMGNTKDLERAEKMKNAIINDGVKYTFGWFKPLVRNGKVVYNPNKPGDYNSTNMILSICQFDENNFALFSSSTGARTREQGAISYKDEADLLLKLGCKYAFSLDSGGSTSFFYKSQSSTLYGPGNLYDNRIIADVLYFVEQ